MTQEMQGEDTGFHVRSVHGVVVVTFAGPKLMHVMGEPLYRLVESEGHRHLVLNFENVRVLTSAPIGVLVNLARRAGSVGGAVRLCRIDPDLVEILRLTGTVNLFQIFDDEAAAVGSFPSD